mmetsp:Transcript_66845/g.157485  ORF Transcript_66845/g.157485 Transcript_66845/m.157485 type:complete len:99 (+) Transcript_66845:49-345(+)
MRGTKRVPDGDTCACCATHSPLRGGIFMKKPVDLNDFNSGLYVSGPVLSGTLNGSRRSAFADLKSGSDLDIASFGKDEENGVLSPAFGLSAYFASLPC